jgi:arylsulfatase A-like enzyme
MSCLDWFPTLTQLAGVKVSSGWKVEGRDVWPLLSREGSAPPAPPLYWNIGTSAAVMQGDWKLIVHHRSQAGVELYNLGKDPAEETNRASLNPAKTAELQRVLATQRSLDP